MIPRHRVRQWVRLLCGLALLVILPLPRATGREIPASWQSLGGPGGRITHLAGTADGKALYAVSVTGVNRRTDQTQWRDSGTPARADALYYSADRGATWQPVTNDLPPGPIAALHVEPDGVTVYVALSAGGDSQTGRNGLWRSPDQGLHWEQVQLDRDDLLIRAITRGPGSPHLFVGAVSATTGNGSYIYRITDGNPTWTAIEVRRPADQGDQTDTMLADLVTHPAQRDTLFLTTHGGDVLASGDAGATWRLANAADAALQGERTKAPQLALRPDDNRGGLLAREQGSAGAASLTLARTTDGGQTWQPLTTSGLPTVGEPRQLSALAGGVFLLNLSSGTYRSTDGGRTWQPLEGALSSGGVADFLVLQNGETTGSVIAATGYGLFVSHDNGALWSPMGQRLSANSKIAGLLTHPARPELVYAISDNRTAWSAAQPPAVLRSLDGGRQWLPAAQGLTDDIPLTAWTLDSTNPDRLLVASWDYVAQSTDGGLSWRTTRLEVSSRQAIAIALADPNRVYLGGRPALRSTDGGATWQPIPVRLQPDTEQPADLTSLAVDPLDARHLWAGLETGVYESRDGGNTWLAHGLEGQRVHRLTVVPVMGEAQEEAVAQPTGYQLYAGIIEGGIQHWAAETASWQPAELGLPAGSSVTAFAADAEEPGLLWAARDGGGVYRSLDGGANWTNVAIGVGDNLGQALATNYAEPDSVFLGTAAAGVWLLSANVVLGEAARASVSGPAATPSADGIRSAGVDARIEVVWPHDWAPVATAQRANVGLRLFVPRSLTSPACGWRPRVNIWQATDMAPAEPLGLAVQRTVDGQPFPYWELNDVDVSRANDPTHTLYYLVRVEGVDTATSVWAHGADPRTYFPQQDVPSGLAAGRVTEVDARIQIVWPHDEVGNERPVAEATLANVVVAFFKHGTRLSMPVGWQPEGLALHGAWNQEVGKPLTRLASVQVRQAGAITYPVWEFNNVPVSRAIDPQNRLYLWVMADGVLTYPNIWAHGADSRTFFPAQDEPIMGCAP